jgi:quercetin dioxygenase-like cupin family protein
MNRAPFIVKPETYKPALKVAGTDVTLLASKESTQGQEFTYQSGEKGMGPPPHSHDWDESFFVVKGSVEFTCDGKTELCNPGTLVFVPGGTIHAFQYGEQGGEMLEVTGTGSRAAQFFTAIDAQVPPGPPDIEKIVRVSVENGVTINL